MLYRLGFVLLLLGMMTADSDSLVVPCLLAVVGSVMVLFQKVKETDHETD